MFSEAKKVCAALITRQLQQPFLIFIFLLVKERWVLTDVMHLGPLGWYRIDSALAAYFP